MLSVIGVDSLIWIKSPAPPHDSRGMPSCADRSDGATQAATRRKNASWPAQGDRKRALFCELELQGADLKGVAYLRVVECRKAELISAVEIVELDVGFAAGHELA